MSSNSPPGSFRMISGRDEAHVQTSAGYHIIGYFLNWGLFGVLSVQVFLYYLAFPRDRLSLKLIVYGLFVLDIIQTVLLTKDAFYKFGVEFSNLTALSDLGSAWFSISIINALNGTIVQLFFAYRITTLSGSRILGGLVVLLAVAGGAGGIASGIRGKTAPSNNMATNALMTQTESAIWLSISSACDVLIAICMVAILYRKRSGINPATDDAVTKIMWLTVETGSITTAVAVITMALTFAYPMKAYCNVSIDLIGKLYSNNFLVILNRRMKISDGGNSVVSPQLTTWENMTSQQDTSFNSTGMEIRIQQQVSSDSSDSIQEKGMMPSESPVPYEPPYLLASNTVA